MENNVLSCEMDICVYNCEGKCVLEGVEINGYGMCGEAKIPSLPKEILEKYKGKINIKA